MSVSPSFSPSFSPSLPPPRFSVVRGGDTIEITHADLVVGDIAEFKYGNTFPVDGILIQVCISDIVFRREASYLCGMFPSINGMSPYIRDEFRKVTKIITLSRDHDVGM